jgi:hypothetical protein
LAAKGSEVKDTSSRGEGVPHAAFSDALQADPDLTRLVEVWPQLPASVRRRVMSLVFETEKC